MHNNHPPTAAEKRLHDLIREESGCIVCRLFEDNVYTPPQIHHCYGRTGDGHKFVLGLCYRHHMADQNCPPNPKYTSRHPNKKAFEKRYMTEEKLMEKQAEILAYMGGVELEAC